MQKHVPEFSVTPRVRLEQTPHRPSPRWHHSRLRILRSSEVAKIATKRAMMMMSRTETTKKKKTIEKEERRVVVQWTLPCRHQRTRKCPSCPRLYILHHMSPPPRLKCPSPRCHLPRSTGTPPLLRLPRHIRILCPRCLPACTPSPRRMGQRRHHRKCLYRLPHVP